MTARRLRGPPPVLLLSVRAAWIRVAVVVAAILLVTVIQAGLHLLGSGNAYQAPPPAKSRPA